MRRNRAWPLKRSLGELRPKLHRYCARMTGFVIDGEDVVQDALMKAINALPNAGSIVDISGWVFRIAHNAALDFLRRRRRLDAMHSDEELEMIAALTNPVPIARRPRRAYGPSCGCRWRSAAASFCWMCWGILSKRWPSDGIQHSCHQGGVESGGRSDFARSLTNRRIISLPRWPKLIACCWPSPHRRRPPALADVLFVHGVR